MEDMKQKLQYTLDYQYQMLVDDTMVTLLNDNELELLESKLDVATKEELFNLIKVYHKEVKRLRLDVKEIIESGS